MKPKCLDLFCGAGGCTKGYQDAGFYVVGVDIDPQPRYVGDEFIRADVLEWLPWAIESGYTEQFALVGASPPCQKYSCTKVLHDNDHPDLVEPTRELLKLAGKPYVIENVLGAPLMDPVILCGGSFGLNVRRHRLFEISHYFFLTPACACRNLDYFVIFGNEVRNRRNGKKAGKKNSIDAGRKAMGIDWMTRRELSQAVPPAYTEYIGREILKQIQEAQQ